MTGPPDIFPQWAKQEKKNNQNETLAGIFLPLWIRGRRHWDGDNGEQRLIFIYS